MGRKEEVSPACQVGVPINMWEDEQEPRSTDSAHSNASIVQNETKALSLFI